MSLSSDFQKLSVGGVVTLYELDASNVGAGVYRFHGHTTREEWHKILEWAGNTNDFAGDTDIYAGAIYDDDADPDAREVTILRDIVFAGETYEPIAIRSDGLEVRGDGRASSPSLTLSNTFRNVPGAISALCLHYDDFAGARLTVITTLAKNLDDVNFIEGNPGANSEHKRQVWFVEQKTDENGAQVKFELSNPVDFEGARIPSREITNYCHWAVHGRYRGEECGYTGTDRFTETGEPTTNPALDKCGGRLSDCRLRFGENNPLPFGGFPSASLINR